MNQKIQQREWYSVSTTSLQRWGLMLVLAAVAALVFFGYQQWRKSEVQNEAVASIARASRLADDLSARSDRKDADVQAAVAQIQEARSLYNEGLYPQSLSTSERTVRWLEGILEIGETDTGGSIRFLSVNGSVEYRRGERGAWNRARPHDRLHPGDWVKTAASSTAEISFADGASYTLRENTMVHLGASRPSAGGVEEVGTTAIHFGWVELNTKDSGRTLSTPNSEARVDRASEALVTYDENRKVGSFAAYDGSVEVTSSTGQSRKLQALQQVEQKGDLLGEPQSLPSPPKLAIPEDETLFDIAERERFELAWEPVSGATRYALRVAPNHFFAPKIIDDENRTRNRAVVGIRGEGSFYWQVAAINRAGLRGPWSDPRAFRVASVRSTNLAQDDEPPSLELLSADQYGSVLILSGVTEAGVLLEIDGEQVSVEYDGSFKKTVQLTQEGRGFVEILATDAAGNETVLREPVFVDAL